MGVPASGEVRRDAGFDSGSDSRCEESPDLRAELGLGVESAPRSVKTSPRLTRLAVLVWVSVFALLALAVYSVVWGWDFSSSAQSGGSGASSDRPMSGRYEVGEDGKLLRPQGIVVPPKPDFPEAAHEETREGMKAFVEYVLQLRTYALLSGDAEALEKVVSPELRSREWVLDKVKKINEKQGWAERAGTEILSFGTPGRLYTDEHKWAVNVEVKDRWTTFYDGEHVHQYRGWTGTLTARAVYEDGAWRLLALVLPR